MNVLVSSQPRPPHQQCLTLFVPRQHPDLDVGQRQDGDGFGDSLLQFVLDGRGSEQLEDPNRSAGAVPPATSRPPAPPAHVPSYRAPPRRRAEPGDPHGPRWHCQLGAAARTSPRSSSPPDLCRPAPASAAPRQRTPASGGSWAQGQTPTVFPDPDHPPGQGTSQVLRFWAAPLPFPALPAGPCPTHVEVVGGDVGQVLVDGVQALQQDGVSTFAVQPDLAPGAADCGEQGTSCLAQGHRSKSRSNPQP